MRPFDLTMTYRLDSDPIPYLAKSMVTEFANPPSPKTAGSPASERSRFVYPDGPLDPLC